MLGNDSTSLASGAAGLGVVFLLTIPSIFDIFTHFRENKPKSATYEDKDGVASKESIERFSTKVPKVLLSVFTIAGLLVSVALAILGTLEKDGLFLESWFNIAIWVCST